MSYINCIRKAIESGIDVKTLPALPDRLGRAGMFAGVTGNLLLAAGGANFPDGYPWEGGKKKWNDDIFLLHANAYRWERSTVTLPAESAYGVSASYGGSVFLVGGSNANSHSDEVFILEWKANALTITAGPRLPRPLANMAGTNVGSLLVVVGGMEAPDSGPLACCYGLDLAALENGWFALPTWGGAPRIFPVTGSYTGNLYLFSGENMAMTESGGKRRQILQDAHCLIPYNEKGRWSGEWRQLGKMPRGMSAGANPAPWVSGSGFLLSGGIDRVTALHVDPQCHPGIDSSPLWYNPETDSWNCGPSDDLISGRVTLPTVAWDGYTYYISGEVRPGVRTDEVVGVGSVKRGQQ